MMNIFTITSMYVKYVNLYKESFAKNYLMKENLGQSVSDQMIAMIANLRCSMDTFLQEDF